MAAANTVWENRGFGVERTAVDIDNIVSIC